jgi:hypothetical protein
MAQMKKTAKASTKGTLAAKYNTTQKKSPKAKPSTIQQIATRFNVTAREARDIATAVGTVAGLKFDKNAQYGRYTYPQAERRKAMKNLKKQVSETVTAAKTGKKGTTSGRMTMADGEYPYTYGAGTKRK